MNIEDIPKLKEFCRDMLTWIEGGCGEHEVFTAKDGLCYNHQRYIYFETKSIGNGLFFHFIMEADTAYPFGGRLKYMREIENRSLYKNTKRLQWLKDNAK